MTDPVSLFTSEDVLRLVRERDECAVMLDRANAKVEAIRTLLGDERFNAITGKAPGDGRSFRGVVEEALDGALHGLTYDELRDHIRKAGMGETIARAPNTFFNTVARLQRLGVAEKIGARLVKKAFADKMPADVRAQIEAEGDDTESTPAVIMRVLKDAKRPLNAADVIEGVIDLEPKTKQGRIYAALSRLALKGTDVGRMSDGRYYLVGVEHAADDDRAPDLF